MNDVNGHALDYRTHILIGSTSSGKMSVICSWPHLPRQAEVERAMDGVHEAHATFLLCTPTSIMPARIGGVLGGRQGSARPFRPRKIRRDRESHSTATDVAKASYQRSQGE
jgi:hypothetical protein